jgi:hypothetical protein
LTPTPQILPTGAGWPGVTKDGGLASETELTKFAAITVKNAVEEMTLLKNKRLLIKKDPLSWLIGIKLTQIYLHTGGFSN